MVTLVVAGWTLASASHSSAQVVQADYDFEASGFITPAGVRPPGQYGGVAPVGYYPSAAASGAACDSGACDSGGCDSMGGGMSTGGVFGGGGCASGGCGGVFGQLGGGGLACGGCGNRGCGACGGLSNLRHMCIFCRGQGCSACQLCQENGILGLGAGGICGFLSNFKPHSEAGICSQRWYDVSLELMMLGHNTGASGGLNALSSLGAATSGPPNVVLRTSDANDGGMEPGFRLSGSLMMGAGSNIEATWIGGHEWDNTVSVSGGGPNLFSFISDFGNIPTGIGFDDTDRSLTHSLKSNSEFDSIELNYRRRTVWPYCRFQGSWLLGLRYIGYDDGLSFETAGELNNGAAPLRFFQSDDQVRNSLFGAQAGVDFWWNITPGVSMGVGGKLGALKNDIDRDSVLFANSLAAGATAGRLTRSDSDSDTAFMGEFEWKLVYRLSHSWTVRTSYYMLAIDDVAFGDIDGPNTVAFVNPAIAAPSSAQFAESGFAFGSLVNHGFSIGAEYVW